MSAPHPRRWMAAGLVAFAVMVYGARPDPVVRAAVGAHLNDVRAASSLPFDFVGLTDEFPVVVRGPLTFHYDPALTGGDESLEFVLHDVGSLWFEQGAARIDRATVFLQSEALGLEEAYERAFDSATVMEAAAGWKRVSGTPPSLVELSAYYADSTRSATDRSTRYAQWQAGTSTVAVVLWWTSKSTGRASTDPSRRFGTVGDSFRTALEVSDDAIHYANMERVYARRAEAGDEFEPLPIQVWLDDPD